MNNLNASKRIRKTVIRIILTKCVPHKSKNDARLLQGPGDDDGFSPRAKERVALRDNARAQIASQVRTSRCPWAGSEAAMLMSGRSTLAMNSCWNFRSFKVPPFRLAGCGRRRHLRQWLALTRRLPQETQ